MITGVVVLTRSSSSSGLENIITITNLSLDGYVINGTRTYSFVENNEAGNIETQVSVEITTVTEEGTISKVGDRTVEISEGDDIETIEDNVKTITGSFVYSVLGKELKMEITNPLVKPATCEFIVSGVRTYTREEGVSILDYGDGTCDNLAVLTLADGTEEQIILGGRGVDLDEEGDDSDEDDSDEENDDSNEDNSQMSCTLTTPCEEVVFEGTSNLSVESIQSGDVLMIIVRNEEQVVVYEKECNVEGGVSLDCISSEE